MIAAPVRFSYGHTGLYGAGGWYGSFLEPHYAPDLDPLFAPPTDDELLALAQKRSNVYNNYAGSHNNFGIDQDNRQGCLPVPNGGVGLYDVRVVHHDVQLVPGGTLHRHYAFVRLPLNAIQDPKIIILCHGGGASWKWDYIVRIMNLVDVFEDAILVFPGYFDVELNSNPLNVFEDDCIGHIQVSDIQYDSASFDAISPDLDQLGFTLLDANSIAILQLIDAIRDPNDGFTSSNEVAFFGTSFGAGNTYHTATLLPTTGTDVVCKAAVACFGNPDSFAPWKELESRRYFASRLDPYDLNSQAMYNSKLVHFIKETVDDFIMHPVHPIPEPAISAWRAGRLDRSLVHFWNPDLQNPMPLQVHHGTADQVVSVENSRWLTAVMQHYPDYPFEYHETPGGTHFIEDLDSMDKAGEWINTYLQP